MKVGTRAKGMVLPALGVGTGMLGSPKIAEASPFLGKYPYLPPIILLIVALALFSYKKARGFAIGLGAVAMVFLVIAIWGKVSGKIGLERAEEAVPTEPVARFEYWWETFAKREPSPHYPYL